MKAVGGWLNASRVPLWFTTLSFSSSLAAAAAAVLCDAAMKAQRTNERSQRIQSINQSIDQGIAVAGGH